MSITQIPPKINEIDWIRQNFSWKVSDSNEIDHVLYFSLLWNIFEDIVCKQDCSISRIKSSVEQLASAEKLNLADFEPCLLYFRDRYITNGVTNSNFDNLSFRRSEDDAKKLVRGVLLDKASTAEKTISALLLIVYRYQYLRQKVG